MYTEKDLINAVKYLNWKIPNLDENTLRACIFAADRLHLREHSRTITSKEYDKKFSIRNCSDEYLLEEEIDLLEMANSRNELNMDYLSETDVECLLNVVNLIRSNKDIKEQLGLNSYYDNGKLKVEINTEELFDTKEVEYHYISEELLELNKDHYISDRSLSSMFACDYGEGILHISHKKELKDE